MDRTRPETNRLLTTRGKGSDHFQSLKRSESVCCRRWTERAQNSPGADGRDERLQETEAVLQSQERPHHQEVLHGGDSRSYKRPLGGTVQTVEGRGERRRAGHPKASSEPEPLPVARGSQQTPSQPEPRQRTEEEEKEEGTRFSFSRRAASRTKEEEKEEKRRKREVSCLRLLTRETLEFGFFVKEERIL